MTELADAKAPSSKTETKTYEIELDTDDYNPHLNCMRVFVRGNWYDCSKVILDGVCIYGEETKDG